MEPCINCVNLSEFAFIATEGTLDFKMSQKFDESGSKILVECTIETNFGNTRCIRLSERGRTVCVIESD